MPDFLLPGLRGSDPLGARAALGLLRVTSRLAVSQPVRLSWVPQPDWVARLTVDAAVAPATWVALLAQDVAQRAAAPELAWRDDLKASPQEYHAFAHALMAAITPDTRDAADFLAAFGSELVAFQHKAALKPTAFDMTSGQQRFVREVRHVAQSLRQPPHAAAAFAEALWGPWRYQDGVHPLGWDPTAERLHAYAAQSPTTTKATSVVAALWLAFESFPLFPTAMVADHRVQTGGFDRDSRWFSWPIWTMPLPLPTVRSLLSLAELVAETPAQEALHARGIAHVYRARRARVGDKGYAIFRPATLVV